MILRIVLILAAISLTLTLILYIALIDLSYVEIYIDDSIIYRFIVPCGSEVSISFNNSYTGSSVAITLEICREFRGAGMITDDAGYEYYSQGILDVNMSLKTYKSKEIIFCTSQRLEIKILGNKLLINNSCARIKSRDLTTLSTP
jgi:hypothetical protein